MLNKNIKPKLTRFIPMVLSLFAISVSGAIIGKHQHQLTHSTPIYIQLRPVDPRSLLQGDYMRLRYQLYLTDEDNDSETRWTLESPLYNQHRILAYVQLDNNQKLISTRLQGQDKQHTLPLIVKNPKNNRSSLYVASKTFMFAEGLADCYDHAEYAKIMVDSQGNAILHSLVGGELQDLGCETEHSWWQ